MNGIEVLYICGCDRSGTTAIGSMLGGQPALFAIPETHFIIETLFNRNVTGNDLVDGTDIISAFQKNWRFQIWDYEPSQDFLTRIDKALFPRDLLQLLFLDYSNLSMTEDTPTWVDHTPMNILHVNWLSRLFPKAKFIHIIRDPRAVAASLMKLSWGPSNVNEFIPFWLQKVAAGIAAERSEPDKVLSVRYEDIIDGKYDGIPKIRRFLGNTQIDVENASDSGLTAYTRYQHRFVGQGLQYGASQEWGRFLSAEETQFIEGALGGIMEPLGYPVTTSDRNPGYGARIRHDGRWKSMVSRVVEQLRRFHHAR